MAADQARASSIAAQPAKPAGAAGRGTGSPARGRGRSASACASSSGDQRRADAGGRRPSRTTHGAARGREAREHRTAEPAVALARRARRSARPGPLDVCAARGHLVRRLVVGVVDEDDLGLGCRERLARAPRPAGRRCRPRSASGRRRHGGSTAVQDALHPAPVGPRFVSHRVARWLPGDDGGPSVPVGTGRRGRDQVVASGGSRTGDAVTGVEAEPCGGSPCRHAELLEDVVDVPLHGQLGDAELLGDRPRSASRPRPARAPRARGARSGAIRACASLRAADAAAARRRSRRQAAREGALRRGRSPFRARISARADVCLSSTPSAPDRIAARASTGSGSLSHATRCV